MQVRWILVLAGFLMWVMQTPHSSVCACVVLQYSNLQLASTVNHGVPCPRRA